MPKKSTSARGRAQHGRAKNQKAFALVTSNGEEQELEETTDDEGREEEIAAPVVASKPETLKASKESKTDVGTKQEVSSAASKESATSVPVTPRSSGQKQRQRVAAQLITAEHFSYVRKDLILIAVLASLMFATIIALYFTFGSTL